MTTIVTRSGKGSPLSHTEMDANLINLNNDKVESSALSGYETSVHAAATYIPNNNIGVTVQAYSVNLNEYAAVNPTTAGLALLDDATASDQRTTLGLGTAATSNVEDFQAADADIPTVSASQAEMEAGTETALRSMSPLRVKQAIAALSTSITSATAQASTSGTSIDFASIPSGVKRVSILFAGVSTNGTSNIIVQLGVSGTPVTTGYLGATTNQTGGTVTNYTSGFIAAVGVTSADLYHGDLILTNLTSNTWVGHSTLSQSNTGSVRFGSGSIPLAGTLTNIRITTAGGTDTFDAGSINVIYG